MTFIPNDSPPGSPPFGSRGSPPDSPVDSPQVGSPGGSDDDEHPDYDEDWKLEEYRGFQGNC